jgi:hypothetical protein
MLLDYKSRNEGVNIYIFMSLMMQMVSLGRNLKTLVVITLVVTIDSQLHYILLSPPIWCDRNIHLDVVEKINRVSTYIP